MKNTGLAFGLFALGYVIATVVGFVTYSIHPTLMWVTILIRMAGSLEEGERHGTTSEVRIAAT